MSRPQLCLLFVLCILYTIRAERLSRPFESGLFQRVLQITGEGNVVISPTSVRQVGALLYLENPLAKDAIMDALNMPNSTMEETLEEFRKLHSEKGNPEIHTMLVARTERPLPTNFKESSKRFFNADIANANFENGVEVAGIVNAWITDKTNNRTTHILNANDIHNRTKILVVEHASFHGKWKYAFDKRITQNGYFHQLIGRTPYNRTLHSRVPMMTVIANLRFGVHKELNSTIIELPYRNSSNSLLIIYPSTFEGLQYVTENLHRYDLVSLASNFSDSYIKLRVPKFRIHFDYSYFTKYVSMHSFVEKPSDNLRTRLEVNSKVILDKQSASIDFNEDGTDAEVKADAAFEGETKYSIEKRTQPDVKFWVERPFIFAIVDERHVHFIGRVTNIPH